ncbi:MAG: amino acid adenylation domain-containing protein [Actinomycetota bacterium]|nr:amino acid adenylation domain-containing protein [Actinomycetota bacterium]
MSRTQTPDTPATLEPTGEAFALPASFAQQRLWFLDRLEPNSATYNVPMAQRLRGHLDVGALESALNQLVERHESLRTGFVLRDGSPEQLISPPRPLALPITDLGGRPEAEAEVQRLLQEEARRPFDLSGDRLIRVALFRLAEQDHVFTLTIHHIVADAWSMGVLNRELTALYNALREGRDAQLPELAIQYGDFAVWQQDWLQAGGLDSQLGYWKQQLAGAPPLLELPTDRPRPAEQSFRGATLRTALPGPLSERLRELSERAGATMFMTLLTAFMTLLGRYSGRSDILVASPVANRNRSELEGIVGLFVNTLVLRCEIDGEDSFTENLARVRETSLDAFSNQDLPFEKLVQEVNPKRDRSHTPLAQVLFVAQNAVPAPPRLAGLEQERLSAERGTAKFDLGLFVHDDPAGLRVSLEYCTALFEAPTISRMLAHLQTLLEAIVADPSRPVGQLALLSDAERDLVLPRGSESGERDDRCVHDLVAEQAGRSPDVVAVRLDGVELSYAELDARANRLAQHLRERGVGPDVVVAIAAERSLDTMVAVLAVLKAGGAYAPVDPSYPQERIEYMLADSGTPVLLTQSHLLERLPAHSGETVCLDRDRAAIAAHDAVAPITGVDADHLAYVLYTSGSTGRPKGVAMSHRPLTNLLAWQLAHWSAPGPARTLQFASLSFDVAFQEIFSTWCSGGTLVLIDESTRRDVHALAGRLGEERIERLYLPFVGLEAICEAAEHLDLTIPSLRDVMTAGEQLKAAAPIKSFFQRHRDATLFNHYGPTESHVVTSYALPGEPADWPALPPIGRPISGARIYLLDRHLQPVPFGVPADLYIGGVSLARGYLGRPELTAERFVEDPFDAGAGSRIYRTGDVARHRPDGNIEFLGRSDDQVKVRGFRVELGEVETALSAVPSVGQAAVMLREDGPDDVRLVGYVTIVPGRPVEASEILSALRRSLPDYMIPQHLVMLTSFPFTPTGKIERKALPAPDGVSHTSTEFAQPTTELEAELVGIWQRVLKVDRIGIDDNFFELGGHSLLAVQLVHAVENELDRICALPMLFRTGTVRSLAAELRAGGADCTTPTVLKLRSEGSGTPIFCIAGVHVYQELVDALGVDAPVYGIFLPYEQEMFENDQMSLSIEEMAAGYLEVVREQQPHGPYVFFGLSVGGLLIYEMAHQLERAGEQVSLLLILDTIVPGTLRDDWKRVLRRRRLKVTSHMKEAASAVGLRPAPAESQRELARLARMRIEIYNHARRRYQLHPYSGRAVLVRSESTVTWAGDALADPTFGWGAHVRELEIYDAVGDHITHLRRPHVQGLATKLRPLIEQARAAPQPRE